MLETTKTTPKHQNTCLHSFLDFCFFFFIYGVVFLGGGAFTMPWGGGVPGALVRLAPALGFLPYFPCLFLKFFIYFLYILPYSPSLAFLGSCYISYFSYFYISEVFNICLYCSILFYNSYNFIYFYILLQFSIYGYFVRFLPFHITFLY